MSITVLAPWDGGTGAVPTVAFRYAGTRPGDAVTNALATHQEARLRLLGRDRVGRGDAADHRRARARDEPARRPDPDAARLHLGHAALGEADVPRLERASRARRTPCTAADRRAASRVLHLDPAAQASATACSRTPRRGSGTASHGRRPDGPPAQPGVGEHLVDRGVVAAGDQRAGAARPGSAPRARRPPRRPAAPGCRAAARTAAGSARRPWSGPARAAGRPCCRSIAGRSAGRSRSRPCGPAARPSRRARAIAAANAAASGAPAYTSSKGSRASNVQPSAAVPVSAPPRHASAVRRAGSRSSSTQRTTRSAGTRTRTHATGAVEASRSADSRPLPDVLGRQFRPMPSGFAGDRGNLQHGLRR